MDVPGARPANSSTRMPVKGGRWSAMLILRIEEVIPSLEPGNGHGELAQ